VRAIDAASLQLHFATVRGSVTIRGGTARLSNNILTDPDANEYVTNRIRGDLVCHGNDPAPQLGDSGGSPNVVRGEKRGQCAGL
jgi:hypothetical protein